MINML